MTATKEGKQSHADAAKALIVSTLAADNGAVLSDIGKAVIALPMFAQVFPQDKWAKAQVKLVADKGQQAAAKLQVEQDLGMTKLPRGVPCEGCKNNQTRNQVILVV